MWLIVIEYIYIYRERELLCCDEMFEWRLNH